MAHTETEVSGVSSISELERDDVACHLDVLSSQWAVEVDGKSDIKPPTCCGVPPLRPARSGNSPIRPDDSGSLQEEHLVELLHKASLIIKKERARFAALQRELDELRQSTVASPIMLKLEQENQELRNQLVFARDQLKQGKMHESRKKHGGEKSEQRQEQLPSKKSNSPSVDRGDSVMSKNSAAPASLTSATTNSAGSGCYSDANHTKRQTISMRRHQLLAPVDKHREGDFTGSPHTIREQQPRRQQKQHRQENLPATEEAPGVVLQSSSSPIPAEDIWRATVSHSHEGAYSLGMITRLRRALAPQPTKEQLGEVIHAMVVEVLRDVRRRGLDLNLTRQAPCVYLCEYGGIYTKRGKKSAPRVVHLSIDSGRLAVKVGGGHENFLEYLERHCSTPIV